MRRELRIGVPCLLLAVLIAGHTAAWFAAGRYLDTGFATWMARQRAAGWQIEAGTPMRGGWPLAATLTVPGLALQAGPEGVPGRVSWHAERVVLSLAATSPDRLGVDLAGAQSLQVAPGPEVAFSADRLHIEMPLTRAAPPLAHEAAALDRDAPPLDRDAPPLPRDAPSLDHGAPPPARDVQGRAGLEVRGLRAETSGTARPATSGPATVPATVPATGLTIGLLTGQIAVGTATSLTLSAEAIDLPPETNWALGPHISSVAVDATVRGAMPPPGPLPAMIAAWSAAGGSVDVTHLALGWGPLGVAATGQAAFDANLQPVGTADLRVIGYTKALDALAKQHVISKDAAMAATAVMTLMSRQPQDGGAPEVQIPLTLRDGTVSMGKTPLIRVPAVVWPHG